MLKRILFVLLILAVFICVPAMADSEQNSDLISDGAELSSEGYKRLKAFGIVEETYTVEDGNNTISRGEFVNLTARLINSSWDGFKAYRGAAYVDVVFDSKYADAVYYLTELGVISGIGENTFLPEEPVTYGAALKILVKLTGNGMRAERNLGGFPHGYITMAYRLDINENVEYSPDEYITLKDALELISNTATAEVYEEYADYQGQNLLELCHDIYMSSGVVERDGNINFIQRSTNDLYNITLNGVTHKTDSNNFNSLLGFYVDCFYTDEKGDKKLIYASKQKNKNEVLEIPYDKLLPDNGAFNISTIVYRDDNGKTKKASLTGLPTVIYNGLEYKEYDATSFNITDGKIILVDNNRDDKYDFVFIEETQPLIVASVAGDYSMITGKNGFSVRLQEDGSYDAFEGQTDKRILLSDIKNGDVLTCAVSKNKKYVKIYRSQNTFGGEISAISDGENFTETEITVNEVLYTFTPEIAQKLKNGSYQTLLKSGRVYEFKADVYGRVAEFSLKKGTYEYAYLIDAGSMDSGIKSHFLLRMFLENEVIFDAYVSGKIKLNGGNKIEYSQLYPMLFDSSGNFVRQLVKVKIDEDGNLKDIMFSSPVTSSYGYTNTEAFSLDFSAENSLYKSTYMSFDGRYNLNANSVIFSVPKQEEYEDGDFKIIKPSSLTDDQKYSIKLYEADSTLCAKYAVVELDKTPEYELSFVVVDKARYNADGNLCIIGISRGKTVTYCEEEAGIFPSGIKNGDVFRVAVKNETVRAAQKIVSLSDFDERNTPFIHNGTSKTAVKVAEGFNDTYLAVYGELYGISAKAISTLNPHGADRAISSHATSGAVIYVTVYDVSEQSVTLGSMNDVVPSVQPDMDGEIYPSDSDTKVLLYRRYGYIREIVVVRP